MVSGFNFHCVHFIPHYITLHQSVLYHFTHRTIVLYTLHFDLCMLEYSISLRRIVAGMFFTDLSRGSPIERLGIFFLSATRGSLKEASASATHATVPEGKERLQEI